MTIENTPNASSVMETSIAPLMMRNPNGPDFPDRRKYRLELPHTPQTVEESGLSFLFLVELICKTMFLNGQMSLVDLSAHSRLSLGILKPVLDFMRSERLCEMTARTIAETSTVYSLSEVGRQRAQDYLQKCRYAGIAPVTLAAYNESVRRQSVLGMGVTKESVASAFQDVVIRQNVLDQLGAAMNSGRAVFVYGPPGGGKTFVAEHLANLLNGNILVPHAIFVDNEIIEVYDPLVHKLVPSDSSSSSSALDNSGSFDPRWELCQRPVVLTGGELTLSMLDLEFDSQSRFYQAPPQVKANNGLLIIDDLGRQIVSAQHLMNRWIVPLDRRMDHLALHTGVKFTVPFDVIVIFSSNIAPSTLADEAFLRRLAYKIYVGQLNEPEYSAIFRNACASLNIPFADEGLRFVLKLHHKQGRPLLACVPRDLLGQLRDFARYQNKQPVLTEELLHWAWDNYFARD